MKKYFCDLEMDVLDREEVLDIGTQMIQSHKTHTLFFLNAHCFNVSRKDTEYIKALRETDLLLNDGTGLKIASWFCKIRFKENLNGTDLIPEILNLTAEHKKTAFFLGGKPGIAAKAAERFRKNNPRLNISGTHSGYFTEQDEADIIQDIKKSGAEILVLGMGVPRQEIWAYRQKDELKNVKLIIAGGAILDFLSGEIKRAPLWIRKAGMEWLFRLYLEPIRMWRRYLIGNFEFFYHIFRFQFSPNKKLISEKTGNQGVPEKKYPPTP